jgi:hypothetical protein
MRSVLSLLDEARDFCGGDAELARKLGVAGNHPNEWRAGKRPISPTTIAMLCDLLRLEGLEAQRLAALAIIANAKPGKREVLRRAFFVSWVTGVVFGAVVMPPNNAQAMTGETVRTTSGATVYTLSSFAAFKRWLQRGPKPLHWVNTLRRNLSAIGRCAATCSQARIVAAPCR